MSVSIPKKRKNLKINRNTKIDLISGLTLLLFFLFCLYENSIGYYNHRELCLYLIGFFVVDNVLISWLGGGKLSAKFLFVVLFLIICTAYSVDDSNPDLDGYKRAYEYLSDYGFSHMDEVNDDTNMGLEYGFRVLMFPFAYLGFSYNWFVTLLVSFSSVLIIKTLRLYQGNYSFIISCYALMTFAYDVFQIRFLLAYSIVFWGFRYILIEQKKDIKKYILCVLLACVFHVSSVFYFLYLLLPRNIVKYYKIIVFGIILLFVSAYLEYGNILTLMAAIIPARKLVSYASYSVEISIFTAAFVAILVLIMIYISKKIYQNNSNYQTRNALLLNCTCLLLIPIVPLTLEFERLLRPILLVDYSLMSTNSNFKSKLMMYAFCLLMVLVSFARVFVIKDLALDVIEYNYFMDFIFS